MIARFTKHAHPNKQQLHELPSNFGKVRLTPLKVIRPTCPICPGPNPPRQIYTYRTDLTLDPTQVRLWSAVMAAVPHLARACVKKEAVPRIYTRGAVYFQSSTWPSMAQRPCPRTGDALG